MRMMIPMKTPKKYKYSRSQQLKANKLLRTLTMTKMMKMMMKVPIKKMMTKTAKKK